MRMYSLLASVVCGFAASAGLGQTLKMRTTPIDEQTQQTLASVFDDRSGPRLYRHDTAAPAQFISATVGTEFVGIHGFDAIGGKDVLTSISCIWGDSTNGSAGRIFVWQADSQGNVNTAVPLVDQTVTVKDALTGRYCEYALTTPVTVTGRFYIGYAAVVNSWQSAYLVSTNTAPTPPGRAWVSGGWPGGSAQYYASIAGPLDPLNFCLPLRASGASGAITYQGRISDGGVNITGPTDMQFRFFDGPSAGSPLSPQFTNPEVPVTQGLFTLELPGDSAWFASAPDVYLEIGVRPVGGGAYRTLSPRQRITRAPAALHAVRAAAADSADSATTAATATFAQSVPWSGVTGVPASISNAFSPWSAATGGIAYSGGRVGIGTATPAAPLHLASGAVGTGWQVQLTNAAASPTFESGMRLSDGGFFEITNRINGFTKFARLDSNGGWSAVSDARLKTDVTPLDAALETVLRLRPVRFRWIGDGSADYGFLAQQVRSVLPETVSGDEAQGLLTVNYSKLSVIAIGAVQAQQKQIEALKDENRDLRERLERLERMATSPQSAAR
ncbi:MAG: tail fiber domain-containing protein [Phycisphaerae bacterium]|nr:tail fiber domain-containing protein [Phycisphaerae bacterium]